MKSENQIKDRIQKLDKLIARMEKHNEKYLELAHKASNCFNDIWLFRRSKYMAKARETVKIHLQATYYKRGLIWALKED